MIRLCRATLIAGALALALVRPAAADPAPERQAVCQTIAAAAAMTGLPFGFLARLLWTESGFRSTATSPAGAQGVAQFMPATAAERGLADPRNPTQAIFHAAMLLAALDREFGNLGLAAAAYNAGAARIVKWLRGLAALPIETRLYVMAVTGRPAEQWAPGPAAAAAAYPLPGLDCLNATAAPRRATTTAASPRPLQLSPALRVWSAQLDDHLVAAAALLDTVARNEATAPPVPRARRKAAEGLCAMFRAQGAACQVGR